MGDQRVVFLGDGLENGGDQFGIGREGNIFLGAFYFIGGRWPIFLDTVGDEDSEPS